MAAQNNLTLRIEELTSSTSLTSPSKRYDEVRQLINIGKEKGYLLYDEVNELLRPTSRRPTSSMSC